MARRGVRDKIICLIAGPGQNLFSFKMESISEHTKNIALLLKKFLLLRWPLSIEDRSRGPGCQGKMHREPAQHMYACVASRDPGAHAGICSQQPRPGPAQGPPQSGHSHNCWLSEFINHAVIV